MDYKMDNIIEITWIVEAHALDGNTGCIPFQELKDCIKSLADKFEELHKSSDWCELDYNEEITRYTNKEIAKELWYRFGEVPMNPETEFIESEWNGFPAGTHREEIGHWFEDVFGLSVAGGFNEPVNGELYSIKNIWRKKE